MHSRTASYQHLCPDLQPNKVRARVLARVGSLVCNGASHRTARGCPESRSPHMAHLILPMCPYPAHPTGQELCGPPASPSRLLVSQLVESREHLHVGALSHVSCCLEGRQGMHARTFTPKPTTLFILCALWKTGRTCRLQAHRAIHLSLGAFVCPSASLPPRLRKVAVVPRNCPSCCKRLQRIQWYSVLALTPSLSRPLNPHVPLR